LEVEREHKVLSAGAGHKIGIIEERANIWIYSIQAVAKDLIKDIVR
jgi:hypothetical protein